MNSQNDFLNQLSQKLGQLTKDDKAKYFMVKVDQVSVSNQDKDVFRVRGTRTDTGQLVYVQSKKSSSGQNLPVVGGLMRADKVSRQPVAGKPEVNLYKAEYFLAYLKNELCLHAIVQPQFPRRNQQTGMDSADVTAFDLETNVQTIEMADVLTSIDQVLLKMLKPWESTTPSALTHDLKGDAIWSPQGNLGATPKVVLRVPGVPQSKWVTGIGAVKVDDNNYRAPTDAEILAVIARNTGLNQFKVALADVPAEKMAGHTMVMVPAASFAVGRDSLQNEKYLGIKEAFNWTDRENTAADEKPRVSRGCKAAFVQLKFAATGRMMVTDVHPSVASRLTKGIPESRVEIQMREASENAPQAQHSPQAAPQAASADRKPSPQPTQQHVESSQPARHPQQSERSTAEAVREAPAPRQQQQASSQRHIEKAPPESAAAVPTQFDSESAAGVMPDGGLGFDDEMLSDLDAIERMNQQSTSEYEFGQYGEDDIGDLLHEADQKFAARQLLPSMG